MRVSRIRKYVHRLGMTFPDFRVGWIQRKPIFQIQSADGYVPTRDMAASTNVGSEVTGQFPSIGASQPRIFTGYGLIAGGQNIPSGMYSDSMIVTVTF